ncbi:MAG: hypothetical protein H0V83_06165 [Rubrobacter sp.]|nr:hypothetical protein [Rubrobacter sp.]
MSEPLHTLMADPMMALVHDNFTGVEARWWWERRMSGGIEVCQELDPKTMSRDVAAKTGKEETEVRRIIEEELGLEDAEPIVLTFEIAGDATTEQAARMLQERSSEPEGIAAGLYRRVEAALNNW